jgi:hypothetical protein
MFLTNRKTDESGFLLLLELDLELVLRLEPKNAAAQEELNNIQSVSPIPKISLRIT